MVLSEAQVRARDLDDARTSRKGHWLCVAAALAGAYCAIAEDPALQRYAALPLLAFAFYHAAKAARRSATIKLLTWRPPSARSPG